MKKIISKMLVVALAALMLLALPAPVFAADAAPMAVTPRMKVCEYCLLGFDPGAYENMAEITVEYMCDPDVFSKIKITASIDKRVLGIFWRSVDIGVTENNDWYGTYHNPQDKIVMQFPLEGEGTYRCNFTVEFTAKDGQTDVIEKTIEEKYNYVGN